MNYSRELLSGTPSSGRPIPVTATGVGGTIIHTVPASPARDEIHLWATNISGSPVPLTIEFGAQANPDDHLVDAYSIPAHSAPIPIVTGQTLDNPGIVSAYAGTPGVINITGYVNRVS